MAEPKPMSFREVCEQIQMDCLEGALRDRISPEEIADPKLKKMWAEAKKALEDIEDYLKPHFKAMEDGVEDES